MMCLLSGQASIMASCHANLSLLASLFSLAAVDQLSFQRLCRRLMFDTTPVTWRRWRINEIIADVSYLALLVADDGSLR